MSNKQKAINGGKWITIATVISTIFQFAQVTILARVLEPSDFGVVSISTLVTNFFYIFSDLGFSNSIIYKQETDRKVLSTIYFFSIAIGVVIFAAIYFTSPIVISYYHEPRLDRVIKLASVFFLIIYFGQTYSVILHKELKFKEIATIDIISAVIGTIVAIAAAYSDFKELSLIYGQLSMHIIRTVLQIFYGIKFFVPAIYFNFNTIKDHLKFGIYNLGDGIVGFVQGNVDSIIVGGTLGVKLLGYYTIANQLTVLPISKINPIILQVAYPILAKIKDSTAELKKAYLNILDFISYTNLPLLFGLYITADNVIPLLYGPGWEQTIDLIKIFVFVSLCICLSHPLFVLAFTKGKPNLLFYLNIVVVLIKVPLIYVFSKYWGVTGIAVAFLIANFCYLILNFYIVHSLIGSFLKEFLQNIYKPLIFCAVMVVAIYFYKFYEKDSYLINTIAEVAIGGLIYVALTLKFKLPFAEIKSLRKSLM